MGIRSKQGCTDCSQEGATVFLRGFPTGTYPEGFPCSTNVLDHESSIDYSGGTPAKFNGKINGVFNEKEADMMGGCYKGGLNGLLTDGGSVTWAGAVGWEPLDVLWSLSGISTPGS